MSCKSQKKHRHAHNPGTEKLTIGVGVGSKRQEFSIHKTTLQRATKYFDQMIDSEAGKKGLIFLNDDEPKAFGMFIAWLKTGNVAKPPTNFKVKTMPSQAQLEILENDLRQRFDQHEFQLVNLYCLAEKYNIEALANNTIDAIQDGFYEYGTVFGPGLLTKIFAQTKKNSPLRDLCVGTNLLHMDRGCGQLREEMMMAALVAPGFFAHMMKWIAQNFEMFGRRQREGYDARKHLEGFSMLRRSKLCPCHFHVHAKGNAHKGHELCVKAPMTCGHGAGDDAMDMDLAGLLASLCPCSKCRGEETESVGSADGMDMDDGENWVDESDEEKVPVSH
ncbi:hypothetical protein G7Y89_g13668 [Cudoniella acicularis]|uniref:BTB domain-containing protein n=1 Tax=Cudoniella acicularis TaxID=354080 RepID=A0A8H4VVT9_9HELO|nr:hypothetical protein G7Y89_g13668 [Cudoniella acicularis]